MIPILGTIIFLSMAGCAGLSRVKNHNQSIPETFKSNCDIMVFKKRRESTRKRREWAESKEKINLTSVFAKANIDTTSLRVKHEEAMRRTKTSSHPPSYPLLAHSPYINNALTRFCCSCYVQVNIFGYIFVKILN